MDLKDAYKRIVLFREVEIPIDVNNFTLRSNLRNPRVEQKNLLKSRLINNWIEYPHKPKDLFSRC